MKQQPLSREAVQSGLRQYFEKLAESHIDRLVEEYRVLQNMGFHSSELTILVGENVDLSSTTIGVKHEQVISDND